MMILVKIPVFLLGMFLSAQLIAALYGIIDLGYTIRTAYPKVIGAILLWGVITGLLALLLGPRLLPALLWGIAALAICHIGVFGLFRLIALQAPRPAGKG